jgi:hypothetical protein
MKDRKKLALLTPLLALPMVAASSGYTVAGYTIGGVVALVAAIIFAIAAFGKGGIANSIKGVLGMIPVGSPKLWAIIGFIFFGLVAGGLSYGWAAVSGSSLFGTASIVDQQTSVPATTLSNCYFATYSMSAGAAHGNTTFSVDTANRAHLYVAVKNTSDAPSASINGTLKCSRSGDIDKAAQVTCIVKSHSFKSLTSTTDSNTYYILATSTQASVVPGYTWAQTAYLNDGSIATTSSNQEQSTIVFPGAGSAAADRSIGFYLTLPGATVFNYLTTANSATVDVDIQCNGVNVGTLTVSKVAA